MAILLMKLTLAPGLVAVTTLAGRRFGALVAGVVGGFPAVVGPILIALDAQHGDHFATAAAAGALAGLISLSAFLVVYAWLARSVPWPVALVGSWAAFALATLALDGVSPSPEVALPLVIGAFTVAYLALPAGGRRAGAAVHPAQRWDLAMRVTATIAFVLVLTGVAGALGPGLSGLLAAFPVLASVLCAFTHAQEGPAAVADFLRGLVAGLGGFAVFCFAVADLLPATGPVVAFGAGTLAATAVNGALAVRALAARRL